jgi:hypothetical protein
LEDNLNVQQIKDNLNFWQMEDDLNISKWKTTSSSAKVRGPQYFVDGLKAE